MLGQDCQSVSVGQKLHTTIVWEALHLLRLPKYNGLLGQLSGGLCCQKLGFWSCDDGALEFATIVKRKTDEAKGKHFKTLQKYFRLMKTKRPLYTGDYNTSPVRWVARGCSLEVHPVKNSVHEIMMMVPWNFWPKWSNKLEAEGFGLKKHLASGGASEFPTKVRLKALKAEGSGFATPV